MISVSRAAFEAQSEYINIAISSPSASCFVILFKFCAKKSISTSSPFGVDDTATKTSLKSCSRIGPSGSNT